MVTELVKPSRAWEIEGAASPNVETHVPAPDDRASRPVVYYEGERICFRPLETEDEPLVRRWINDPNVWATLCHRRPLNAIREREWIESLGKSETDVVFGVVVKDENRLIGTTGLHRIHSINRSAVFGIALGDRAYHNRGYGTEAVRLTVRYGFEELNLNRIALSVFSHNLRAIRCYQKAGFVHEGCLREAFYRNGTYHDEYRFALLRDEWQALRGGR
jgi:RimJ/RimL family protein N-acetyltransferase